jgi:tetraprenyl-beta-curcumene synthase
VAQTADALPLNWRQLGALARAVVRELGWGLRAVSVELSRWRQRAAAIPDPRLREDALHALDAKRGHTDGAALFWTLPDRRDPELLRLLVAYEVIYDYLDNVSERGAEAGVRDGRHLFCALADAVDPDAPQRDPYRDHPWRDDGGYLQALVEDCRRGCRRLPAFATVRPYLELETARVPVLALNHELDPARRDAALRAWAAAELGQQDGLRWYEASAAASQSVVVFALLALAAETDVTDADAAATYRAYFPWFAYAVTMLDSFVDQADDQREGAHSYVTHYPEPELAVVRLRESLLESAERQLALPHGERHAILLGCMIAMYLSKDSARVPDLRAASERVVAAGGSLTSLLLPVLRLWRVCNDQTAKT